jgi:hypothetical protein
MVKFKIDRFNPQGQEALGTIYITTRLSENRLYEIIERVVDSGAWDMGWNGWDKAEKGFKIHFDLTQYLNKDNFDTYAEFVNERDQAVKDLVEFVNQSTEYNL